MAEPKPDPDRTRERLLADGVVTCIRFSEGERVVELARAAVSGGLGVLEITLTTPGALEAIAELSSDPGALVGAGTVLSVEDVADVADAGARFALSPVCDVEVMRAARERGLLAIPGAGSATEILNAHREGAPLVKVFPSGALGGPAFLRAVRGPLAHVPMIPTSGPTIDTMEEWFDAGAVAVGVGPEVFATPSVDAVERAARRVRAAVDRARTN